MTGVDQLVGALSGGNQQKVVLAKWLASKPRILILDEPTRGIDIGAKVEVHRIISELAASGLGIILISSDLPEVLAMSDRIIVLHEGRITAEIPRARATEERVMFAATGSADGDEDPAVTAVEPRCARWLSRPCPPPSHAAGARASGSPTLARQRELSLVAIMVVLGGLVYAHRTAVPDRLEHQPGRGPRRRSSRSPPSARPSSSSPGTSTSRSRRRSGWSPTPSLAPSSCTRSTPPVRSPWGSASGSCSG